MGPSILRLLHRQHDLRLCHDGGELAVTAGNIGLQHNGGEAAVQWRADGACGIALRNWREEIGLAFDRRGALALSQSRAGGHSAHGVGPAHQGPAVDYAAAIAQVFADVELGLAALCRSVDDLHPHELDEGGGFPLSHGWSFYTGLSPFLSR